MKNILIVCSHRPEKDPRVLWHFWALHGHGRVTLAFPGSNTAPVDAPDDDLCPGGSETRTAPVAPDAGRVGASLEEVGALYEPAARPKWKQAVRAAGRLMLKPIIIRCKEAVFAPAPSAGQRRRDIAAERLWHASGWVLLLLVHTVSYFPKIRRELDIAIGGRKFDIVIANDLECLESAIKAKAPGGCLVYDAHENWPQAVPYAPRFYTALIRRKERRLARQANVVTAVSPGLVQCLADELRHPDVRLLPNAVPYPHFPAFQTVTTSDRAADFRRDYSQLAEGRMIFLFQGGIAPQRGLREIVAAWRFVDNDQAILVIRAPDTPNPENDAVIKIARQHGLLGNTVFRLPSISEADLGPSGEAADVGLIPYNPVFPNHVVACPNKLSQFMLSGCAILTNRLPYPMEIVSRAQCGMVYDHSKGPEHIASVIASMASDRESVKAMGGRARSYAQHDFNWQCYHKTAMRGIIDDDATSGERSATVTLEARQL